MIARASAEEGALWDWTRVIGVHLNNSVSMRAVSAPMAVQTSGGARAFKAAVHPDEIAISVFRQGASTRSSLRRHRRSVRVVSRQ